MTKKVSCWEQDPFEDFGPSFCSASMIVHISISFKWMFGRVFCVLFQNFRLSAQNISVCRLFKQHQTRLRLVGRCVQPFVCVPELLLFRGGKLLTSTFLEHEHRKKKRKKKKNVSRELVCGIVEIKLLKFRGGRLVTIKSLPTSPAPALKPRMQTFEATLRVAARKSCWLVNKKSKNILNPIKFSSLSDYINVGPSGFGKYYESWHTNLSVVCVLNATMVQISKYQHCTVVLRVFKCADPITLDLSTKQVWSFNPL